ncbi:mannose-specific lectin-like isoform X1 [Astyanax mexicanus]|uniref:Mannose-specific lectin-like isoform X1 n=1 Tax=Astyanax mexicanus TaxID=7994 RepID=A0A8T2LSW6_ASTMX|nr:mannose-specific lectin-like isoform X1 [Astyanax mexicanus]
MSRNYMSKYDELRKGDYLWSNNKEYKAVFQDDGNFVIFGWRQVWSSDTGGVRDAHRLCMQDDCNLVLYKRDDKALWHTNTHRAEGVRMCHLYLCNDGNLVIERDGEEVWNSAQSRGQK